MLLKYPVKLARKYYKPYVPKKLVRFNDYVQYWDEDANELVRQELLANKPSLICKLGTVELLCMLNYLSIRQPRRPADILRYIKREKRYLWWWDTLDSMANNAGLFPATPEMAARFSELMLDDIRQIDIMGSYFKEEVHLQQQLAHTRKINLEGYYAPFRFANPWTAELAGKKVLVVHPFEESIRQQYAKRELLFENPAVLPEFELRTIKAVQTIANNKAGFDNWFGALDYMKGRINETDFDIALIGCGAYGMPLAAHVKRMGKKAVHLAGWTQVLFGIYGRRWQDDPDTRGFINEHWTKPLPTEVPANFNKVENGAYW